jgi:hypothetical protein
MNPEPNPQASLPPAAPSGPDSQRPFAAHRAGRLLLFAASLILLLPAIGALSTSPVSPSAPTQTSRQQTAAGAGTQPAPGSAEGESHNPSPAVSFRNTDPNVAYVGSTACEGCHQSEFRKFLETTHGLATTAPEGRAELQKLPPQGVTVCQPPDHPSDEHSSKDDSSRETPCYRVYPAKDGYYMSQFDRAPGGRESHTETEKIAFALGKPLIATGYVIQRGDYLFEAPLTYYKEPVEGQVQGWGLSPGYGKDAVGFTRLVVDSCLTCHLGRPSPTDAASNRYLSPPYEELSIGCESCHGPGALHVKERQAGPPLAAIDSSIVNPKHLSSQLADETCMYCHEPGQARVPLPGKIFQDYRPGVPLLRTQAIFKSKLLLGWNVEEWSDEMATSACFRLSKGALRCSSCHDPHFTPTAAQAPDFYRTKCLSCHQSASCTLPLSERQHTQPVDNCIACHMPQHVSPKLVKLGGRGTSHRITRTDDEPLPPADTPRTSPDPATGLILVNADSPQAQSLLPREVLLSAYQGVFARDTSSASLIDRYRALLEGMTGEQHNPQVLSALAGAELAKRTPEGNRQAIADLNKAVDLNSRFPKDYLLLSDLELRSGDPAGAAEAIRALSLAIERFPYNPTPYENLVECYRRSGNTAKASETLNRALKLFPSDRKLLQLATAAEHP